MNNHDSALLLGRVLASFIFLLSGWTKLTTAAATKAYFVQVGVPLPELAWGIAVVTELAGALMLLTGFRTRLGALMLGMYCVATAIMVHTDWTNRQAQMHFTKNFAMAGGYLAFMAAGGGAYSLDRLFLRRRQTVESV